jgi:hypothetical protein
MPESFSQRLLTLLQFTRMALVFTAVSNSLCTYLLAVQRRANMDEDWLFLDRLDTVEMLCIALVSIGLYGFGMSLNDIIDRRRDRQLAAHRPLPAGKIGLMMAHVICIGLGLMALAAGGLYAYLAEPGWRSMVILLWTAALIIFYDFAGKYLVAVGLLSLGLIRFFHAIIPAPEIPVLWHPLLLFVHVTVLSAVAYLWEEKRPPLTRLHWGVALGGVAAMIVMAGGIVLQNQRLEPMLRIDLLLPAGLAGLFVLIAWRIRRSTVSARQAGQTLMLAGLLWLIVYDSAFALLYVGWRSALGLLLLAPISYLSVLLMRWSARLMLLSQQPEFKRVRDGAESA